VNAGKLIVLDQYLDRCRTRATIPLAAALDSPAGQSSADGRFAACIAVRGAFLWLREVARALPPA
jgi:hypothetical protein